MTIYWTFYNTPRSSEYFEAKLSPSIGDHIFQFNLAVHTPGDKNWMVASKNFMPGSQAGYLRVEGHRDQDLLLLVKDANGAERRIGHRVSDYWVDGGDIGTMQSIPDYRRHFITSLGISEEQMYCKALFEEYQELEAKTSPMVQDIRRGGTIKIQPINNNNTQDLIRRKVLAKELVKLCKDYFNDKFDEWYNLELDAQD